MKTSDLFQKHFGVFPFIGIKHPNIEAFFEEINQVCLSEHKPKKVIDGDNMKCLELFDESQTETILQEYRENEKWADVSTEINSDIILFED